MALMAYKPSAVFSPSESRVEFQRVAISFNLTRAQAEEVTAAIGQHVTQVGFSMSDIKLVLMPEEILKEWGAS